MIQEKWDTISEHELDCKWKENYSEEFKEYRQKFELANKRKYLGEFPLSIEIEATYYCNLKCPYCPRFVNPGQRTDKHMSEDLWKKILDECEENKLPSILMDHEAESLMNPRIFDMISEAKEAGIMDIWLHSNANLLKSEWAEKLIDNGLTKINFSIDASTPETYEKLRVGGDFEKVKKNIKEFLRLKNHKKAHYLRVRVSFCEQEENMNEKKSFYSTWKDEEGINLITFQDCIDFSGFEKPDEELQLDEESLEKKYASDEPFHCSQPWEMPIIEAEGNVIPCGQPVREHNKDFILGNILEGDTIKSCWNGEKMTALRELHDRGEWYKNPMCRVCVKSLRQSKLNVENLRMKLLQSNETPVPTNCEQIAGNEGNIEVQKTR